MEKEKLVSFVIDEENYEYLLKCKKQGYILKKVFNRALKYQFIWMKKNNLFVEMKDPNEEQKYR